MANTASSTTPKGTPPMPTRRATKHKRASYGRELKAKAEERRKRRAEAAKEAAKEVSKLKIIPQGKRSEKEKAALEAATLKANRGANQKRPARGW